MKDYMSCSEQRDVMLSGIQVRRILNIHFLFSEIPTSNSLQSLARS